MQAAARRLSVVSATSTPRRRLSRSVRLTNVRPTNMNMIAYSTSDTSRASGISIGSIKIQRNNEGYVETHKSSDSKLFIPNHHYMIEPIGVEVVVLPGHSSDQLIKIRIQDRV